LAQARSGEIPMARLNDAVRRVLRVKARYGLFGKGKPSARPFGGQFGLLGSPAHRAVARQAVRESLVLLKNQRQLLPLSPKLDVLKKLDAAGIPVVSVFLSGRPLWVNPEINASDAFVAAFLPGSEGGGVADVLFRNAKGRASHDFHGKLSFSWPKRADQTPLN